MLLHTVMKFYLEMMKTKEMRTFLYILSDHPSYVHYLLVQPKALYFADLLINLLLLCIII